MREIRVQYNLFYYAYFTKMQKKLSGFEAINMPNTHT